MHLFRNPIFLEFLHSYMMEFYDNCTICVRLQRRHLAARVCKLRDGGYINSSRSLLLPVGSVDSASWGPPSLSTWRASARNCGRCAARRAGGDGSFYGIWNLSISIAGMVFGAGSLKYYLKAHAT